MFTVNAKFWTTKHRGTPNEYTQMEYTGHDNGPFETRASAEAFARGLATQRDIAQVQITEDLEGD
jgi:hypothetical protein